MKRHNASQRVRLVVQVTAMVLLARMVLGLGGGDFEKWCPFGGIETTYLFFFYDTFSCSLGSSNLYVALFVLVLALLTRRSFCSYVCPVGALGEWSGKLRDKLLPGRRTVVPARLDAILRKIKYPLLVLILYFTFAQRELIFRAFDPFYALCSKHGEDITYWSYVVLGGALIGAFLISQPFCRYLCPFAAVLNPFSRFGLLRVQRDLSSCVDCGLCNRVCDSGIDVAASAAVTHARCTQCLECISVCPVEDSLFLGLPGKAGAAPVSQGGGS
ncbi:MAG: 4Fe-4S binding protein [Planctomycetota bacterium]|jgi:polyferredoxin